MLAIEHELPDMWIRCSLNVDGCPWIQLVVSLTACMSPQIACTVRSGY